jgi:ClpP class serine protease
MSVLQAALREAWAMESSAHEVLLTIAAREHEISPEALEAYRAKDLANSDRATERNGVAILAVTGPLFRRANILTAISGATSYDIMRSDLQAAVDAKPKGILLNVDSPGGAVNGASELAQAVYDLRGRVPIVAYIGGAGASAAYWIASAADRIVVDPTAIIGSIGVQMAMEVAGDRKGAKSYSFISSQSPMKNAGPDTAEGAAAQQGTVDALAKVFVDTVARNRGVSSDTVLADFGKGGIFVGKAAVAAGMADAIGTFESVLAGLAGEKG